jgi:nucleotide-binding universal stress UspA family protein
VSRLIAVCEINDADLLVIGRRGAGLAERVILGSTADRLTHLAPCPVLVIP